MDFMFNLNKKCLPKTKLEDQHFSKEQILIIQTLKILNLNQRKDKGTNSNFMISSIKMNKYQLFPETKSAGLYLVSCSNKINKVKEEVKVLLVIK